MVAAGLTAALPKESTHYRVIAVGFCRRGRAERHRLEANRLDREREQQERERAATRQRYLDELVTREGDAWEQVEALIATRQPRQYDEAVALIRDLMEVAERGGRRQEAAAGRVDALCQQHARKDTFIARLRREGIIAER